MIAASYIARFLKDKGVTHVFGFDGSMMLKIADEISLLDGIDYYQGFHEQASAFAADAYGRLLHTTGVVLVTSGPGAINALAGCADAFLDSIPLLVITGQDRYSHLSDNPGVRLNGFQDLDIVSVASPITKYAVQITDASQVAYEFEKAWHIASSGRKGPVLVDVPMDIQFDEVPDDMPHYIPLLQDMSPAAGDMDRVTEMIRAAKRPVILAGGGIHSSDADGLLFEFVQKTGIPVVTTLNGHDAYPGSIGTGGFFGLPEANLALRHADLMLALGTRFGERQAGKFVNEYTRARIVHVDIDELELGRVLPAEVPIRADVREFLRILCDRISRQDVQDLTKWRARIAGWKETYQDFLHVNPQGIDPLRFVEYIGDHMPEDAVFTNDVGQNTMWVAQGLKTGGRHRLLTSSGYASMGFSLPAAIGAKMADPSRAVLSFSGDGGFHMNLQELQFVKLRSLNIKFAVFNNNTLGMMREVQRIYYNNNFVGSNTDEFTCVDLERVAALYDMDYLAVSSEADFAGLDAVLSSPRAAIIDCRLPLDTYERNWNEFMSAYPEAFSDDD